MSDKDAAPLFNLDGTYHDYEQLDPNAWDHMEIMMEMMERAIQEEKQGRQQMEAARAEYEQGIQTPDLTRRMYIARLRRELADRTIQITGDLMLDVLRSFGMDVEDLETDPETFMQRAREKMQ